MKTNFKRFLAFVLTMVMVFAYIPAGAFATEGAAPARPTATVSEIKNGELTFAMNFKADEVTEEQLAYYGDWYADFELTVNKDVTFNANGGADGYLSGQYDEWSENWVTVPFENVTLKANETLKIMEYASELMGKTGLKLTYNDVYTSVKNFDCGVFFEPEFLAANPDLKVTLELRMYNPENESESYNVGETYIYTIDDVEPALPTATVSEVKNDALTFAMNFKADEVTEEQLAFYGDWYADFELTVNKDVTFNANGGADGYLSGQYDAWSENWVNVPFEDVTLKANETLKIMAYASELMGKTGLKLTYNDVYTSVKNFDCGVFFEPAFLEANPDLKVTLELRMYNPENESESYTVGTTYVFEVAKDQPAAPTATVTEVSNDELTFAMNFKADETTAEQLEYYGDWYADFELTVNKDVTFNANGGADGYLSGQYDAWSENWVNVPFENVTLEANKPLKIMEYASELMGKTGLKLTYNDVYTAVKDFDCGVFFEPAFLAANPDLKVTLELKMYDPEDASKSYVIGESYIFENTDFVAKNVETGKIYSDVSKALEEAASNQTVILLKDAKDWIVTVLENTTFDLNGYKLTADYVACFGNVVDNSDANSGRLIVDAKRFLIQEKNAQLPVKTESGYLFAEVEIQDAYHGGKYVFQPFVEAAAHEALKAGKDASGVSVEVQISWKKADGTRHQNFVFSDAYLKGVLESYKPATGKYENMFTLGLTGGEDLDDLYFQAMLCSNTSVAISAQGITRNESEKPEEGGKTTETTAEQTLTTGDNTAVVQEGTKVEEGTDLALTVTEMTEGESNIEVGEGESKKSVDIHVTGVAADNEKPIIVTLPAFAESGMNEGNLVLYHVENNEPNTMTQVASIAEVDAHNEFFYNPATGDVTMALASFSEIAVLSNESNPWNGEFDYSWYDASKTELTIANADQLAAFGAIVGGMVKDSEGNVIRDSFAGKTVKLIANINLGDAEKENKENLIFYPIGYYNSEGTYEKNPNATEGVTSGFYTFEGTFDGTGHTIFNFYQNTWEMKGDNNYYDAKLQYYRDGMGLFGRVYGGTVKNLTIENFSSDGEYTTTGVIAAYADFGATFENIAIFNCNPRVYNIGNGGIVGCVGWYTKDKYPEEQRDEYKVSFKNITVDNSNKISALWGSYDVPCGGIVGQYYPTSGQSSANYPENAGIHMENCHVSAQLDVYNDVCANYQYYAYRYAGMLVGSVRENVTDKETGHVYPKMDGITATGCTVHFGTWNDYYYCEIIDNTTASYTHDYQMSRLTEIKAINGTTITYLDGTTGGVPISGRANYVIVDYTKGHGTENATCYHFKDGAVWTHDMGGIQTGIDENGDGKDDLKEDKQHIYLEFNNLITGYGWGVSTKGVEDVDGVEILDRNEGSSVEKFVKADNAKTIYMSGDKVTIGELFAAIGGQDNAVEIKGAQVQVAVSPVGQNSTAGGTYDANADEWTQGTLTFSGDGFATITITDYYFCKPTTIEVYVQALERTENMAHWA